jgi:glycosyltransferase involved in cell wall biosynthesis
VASILEYIFRVISRDTLTFTVGKEMFDIYRRSGRKVYQAAVSLVSNQDISDTVNEQRPTDSGQIRLLSVGRLDPEKGVVYLIRAVDELVAHGKTDIILDIVGKGMEEKRLRGEVSKRGLDKYVHFLGYMGHRRQLLDLYRRCDIFVLPSLSEGWPQTLFEAMSCGVPVVATGVGGIPYIIEDGENGLLINSFSSRALYEAIERLIGDSRLRRRLIRNGLFTVKNHTLEAERDRIMFRIQEFLGYSESYSR